VCVCVCVCVYVWVNVDVTDVCVCMCVYMRESVYVCVCVCVCVEMYVCRPIRESPCVCIYPGAFMCIKHIFLYFTHFSCLCNIVFSERTAK